MNKRIKKIFFQKNLLLSITAVVTVLVKDLKPLGKALARRGSYKQIAAAAFSCQALKNCLINKTLERMQ